MLNANTMCKVKNRSSAKVAYTVQYNGNKIHQSYNPGEVKNVPYEELRQLSYQHGGPDLIYNYLQIGNNAEILNSFNLRPEPEYFLNENQIKNLLLNGSLDEFLDCLDFAPMGVIDLIKKYAVDLPLNDYNKRRAIQEVLGFDVDAAIKNDKLSKEDTKTNETPTRRVTEKKEVEEASATPQRRVIKKKVEE